MAPAPCGRHPPHGIEVRQMTAPVDALALMRTRAYVKLLVLAVLLGVPVSAAAFGFLKLTSLVQGWAFTSIPKSLGFDSTPTWWPVLPLAVAGLLVGLT